MHCHRNPLLAGATVRTLITGENFGQSLVDEAPNTVAAAIGDMLGSSIDQKLTAPADVIGDLIDKYAGPTPAELASGQWSDSVGSSPANAGMFQDADLRFLDFGSGFARRSDRYLDVQSRVQQMGYSDSFYFQAAAEQTANLASMDIPIAGAVFSGLTPDVQIYINSLSDGISALDNSEFARLRPGQMTSSELDNMLSYNEQSFIQDRLGQLLNSNPGLYDSFMHFINSNANMSGPVKWINSATDYDISVAASNTANLLGSPIDFAIETDRLLMQQQTISIVRENAAHAAANLYRDPTVNGSAVIKNH